MALRLNITVCIIIGEPWKKESYVAWMTFYVMLAWVVLQLRYVSYNTRNGILVLIEPINVFRI